MKLDQIMKISRKPQMTLARVAGNLWAGNFGSLISLTFLTIPEMDHIVRAIFCDFADVMIIHGQIQEARISIFKCGFESHVLILF